MRLMTRSDLAVAVAMFGMLAAGIVHAAATPAPTDDQVAREYRATVALDVDTQGKIAAIELPAEVPAMLAGPAREAIAHWRFKPPVRDGHAVTARTWAKTVLQVVRQPGGHYGLRAVFQSNGPGMACPQPRYPAEEMRRNNQGSLAMEAVAQPNGTVIDTKMVSHQFKSVHVRAFEQAVKTALAQCHVSPEWVDGKPVATRMRIPFVFTLHYITAEELASMRKGAAAEGVTASEDDASGPSGEAVALDSPVQPLEPGPQG